MTPALICATFVVAAAAATFAQSEAPKPKTDVEIGGYCPVAYAAMNQAVKGNPEHRSVHQGKTYHLTNAQAKQMFDAAPAKFLPKYDGLCATGVAQGMNLESDPTLFTVHEGSTYLFSNKEAKAMFDKDKPGTIAKADTGWATLRKR